ncbi:MAG: 50S ribosomal protein L30 [Chloroflexota bacterium]
MGYNHDQKDTIRKLGFRRLQQTIQVDDTPAIRGMLAKVSHLVEINQGDS